MEQSHQALSWRFLLWPAAVTLGVTLLRLTGELAQWSPTLFNRAVGGGAALVGIIWLVPVFGYYFGRRLVSVEAGPRSVGRALGADALALTILAASSRWASRCPSPARSSFSPSERDPGSPSGLPLEGGRLSSPHSSGRKPSARPIEA